jgi:[protein-PII] uridylyltransferase
LARRRDEIRAMHGDGTTGSQVAAALTVLIDDVVARLATGAVTDLAEDDRLPFESDMAVVAIGGYGRAELAPFSDVDLMFLYRPKTKSMAEPLWSRLVRDVWDARLVLGSSIRTPSECVTVARQNISVHTALLEVRHLVGDPSLTAEMLGLVGRITRGRDCNTFIKAALDERLAEQAKSGSNVHLLEPDVKRSKGGLRELHLLRWIAHARFGVASIDRLEKEGLLSADDAETLREARNFLLRVRNELHFHAGRSQDILSWDEQVRLAELFGYEDRPGMRAVEQFMQQYYRQSAAIDDTTDRFIRRCRRPPRWHSLIRPFTTQRVGRDFRIFAGQIAPSPEASAATFVSLDRSLELFALANRHHVVVADDVREQIRAALPRLNSQDLHAARATLLQMLAEPGNLEQTLHHLHAIGILEKLIPQFTHARGLIQFNQYHKYTVDEHTLLCVANAEKLLDDHGPFGQAYREIRHKEILHLALLLHDLGKGFEADHSELGESIAKETAEQFKLETHRSELLVFLVRYHLLLAHLAFRRDTSDAKLLADFARRVGTPEVLRMLFVLTAADVASVGPEAWTTWKAELLCDLYARTMEILTGQATTLRPVERANEVREQVSRKLGKCIPDDWLAQQFAAMPTNYLLTAPAERIAQDLITIHQLPDRDVLTTAEHDGATQVTAYTVYTFDNIAPGLFSKIAGVLAAKGLQILEAQIITLTSGEVIDRFEVLDYDYTGTPPANRTDDVQAKIRQVLRGEQSIEAVFARSSRIGPRYHLQPHSMQEPTQVRFDNETSEK